MSRIISSSVYCPRCCGILGCTDPNANNYNPEATIDDGSCRYDIYGCTNRRAINYNPSATIDDGSCRYSTDDIVYGCTNPSALNYNPNATIDDGTCRFDDNDNNIYGCTDPDAYNYNPIATVNDGSCDYQPPCPILSCDDVEIPSYEELQNTYWGKCYGVGGGVLGNDANNPPVRGRFSLRKSCIRFYYRVVNGAGVLCEGRIGPDGARDLKSALELAFGYQVEKPSLLNGEDCGLYIYPIQFYSWVSNCTYSDISALGGAQIVGQFPNSYCNYIRIYNIDAFTVGC